MGRTARVPRDREQEVRRKHLSRIHRLGDAIGAFYGPLERTYGLAVDDPDRAEEVALFDTKGRQERSHRPAGLQHHKQQVGRRRAMPAPLRLALRARDQSFDPPTHRRHRVTFLGRR